MDLDTQPSSEEVEKENEIAAEAFLDQYDPEYQDKHRLPVADADWPSFDENSIIESAVVEVSASIQTAREMAIASALGAMSMACQKLVDVAVPDGSHKTPVSLMLLVLAETGERKTTLDSIFVRPIKALQAQKEKAFAAKQRKFLIDNDIVRTKEKALKQTLTRQTIKGESTEAVEQQLHELAKDYPEAPRPPQLVYENTTPSALSQGLYDNIPLAYLVSDEAGGMLKGYAFQDPYLFNSLWSGSDVLIARRTRHNVTLREARLSVSLMVQPGIFEQYLKKRGDEFHASGLSSRLLVVKPRSMMGLHEPQGTLSLGAATDRFHQRLHDRLAASLEALETGTPCYTLTFSAQAKILWNDMFARIERENRKDSLYAHATGHGAKLMDNVSRIAAIVHTFENDQYEETPISKKTLSYAFKLCRHFSKHYLEYVVGEPKVVRLTHLLVENLRKLRDRKHATNASPMHGYYEFNTSMIKQYGSTELRKEDNLYIAMNLLMRLGHLTARQYPRASSMDDIPTMNGITYKFSETIFKPGALENGGVYHVKALPRFIDQEPPATGGTAPLTQQPYQMKAPNRY